MKESITALILSASALAYAGPVDFGRAEFARALAERKLNPADYPLVAAVRSGPPESYSIEPGSVTGADERGLMYGLLAAAEQIRQNERMIRASGHPATAMRGIRWFIHNADLEEDWYYSHEHWTRLFQMLARNRFNRFNLVFAHQTNYMSPPYPFWLQLQEFPDVRPRRITADGQRRNLEMLQYITRTAQEHGIDFVLGIWQHNVQSTPPNVQEPVVDGLTRENIGQYSYAALKKTLDLCPGIRGVQLRTNAESGIPGRDQLDFYGHHVFRAVRDAGRTLDIRGWSLTGGLTEAAAKLGLHFRVSTKYWAEYLGRPYPPAETYSRFSYGNYLEKPRRQEFFWELWGLGSHRLLLWGDPGYVRRVVSTLSLGDGIGFEIDPPLAQKGFGNQPGRWSIFRKDRRDLVHWRWEWERYWLFYLLWGRLSYDPGAPASTWLAEARTRFGSSAEAVLDAYCSASQVLHEIVAVHLADPNMYIWPELNPGGLIDSYMEAKPSDWRYVASIPEAVGNALSGTASAKQTPSTTAFRLEEIADRIEASLAQIDRQQLSSAEWQATRTDFRVLAALARYHADKQRGAEALAWFDRTASVEALDAAEAALKRALGTWELLVAITENVYAPDLVFGPQDGGHWKDKLSYVRHDLESVRDRREVLESAGVFERGFDLGGPLSTTVIPGGSVRNTWFVRANHVAPRFEQVDADTLYTDTRGYGWTSAAIRTATTIPLAPYRVVRGADRNPAVFPRNTLVGDSVCGAGEQKFQAKLPPGEYNALLVHPDRRTSERSVSVGAGPATVLMPSGEWCVSAIVFRRANAQQQVRDGWLTRNRRKWPRPVVSHEPPATARAGTPLRLRIEVRGAGISAVRLHYRHVNQLAKFQNIELDPGQTTVDIPGAFIAPQWDLMYYFEILNTSKTGWFEPDPATRTPYYVVRVQAKEEMH